MSGRHWRPTATILRFPREVLVREWRIVELERGQWRAELHWRGHGMRSRTDVGSLSLVRDTIVGLRDGLPLSFHPLRAGKPGRAA